MKTTTIRLGEADYDIRQFKIGELENVMQIFQDERSVKVPFAVLRVAMKANGHPDLDDLVAGADEITAAFAAVMEMNGMAFSKPGEAPQRAA